MPPAVIRTTLNVAVQRGVSAARLCQGLGFKPSDLLTPEIRVSYRQTGLLVRRAQHALNDPALGLAAGAAQTVVSWGLAGLGMLACRTLGEAVAFVTYHQFDAGALLEHRQWSDDSTFTLEVVPRYFDPQLEPYLVEDALASVVSVARSLVGAQYRPLRVELAYPEPAHGAAYKAMFNCPVRFDCTANRLVSDVRWLAHTLPTFDHFTADSVRARLVASMAPRRQRDDLIECVAVYLRANLDRSPTQADVAADLNLSERTLRRRLDGLQVSYRALVDEARYERALDLLQRTDTPVREIALVTGFGDTSNFRRAFKRWAGKLPSQVRR